METEQKSKYLSYLILVIFVVICLYEIKILYKKQKLRFPEPSVNWIANPIYISSQQNLLTESREM